MAGSPKETRAAYLEEFNEEDQVALPETRRTASTTSTTENTVKPSKSEKAKPKSVRDEFSDSGYSSHTIATLGSGDSSSLASKVDPNSSKPDDRSADSHSTLKNNESKPQSRSQSPEKKPIQRNNSKSKGYETSRTRKCECPKCLTKGVQRASAALDMTRPGTSNKHRPKSKPPSPTRAQFQTASRPYPAHDMPVMEPPQPRPRAATSQSYQRARPVSFHAGTPLQGFVMPQPVMIERAPTPAYPTTSSFPPPSYPPEPPFYPVLPMPGAPQNVFGPAPSPYDLQSLPVPRQWVQGRPRSSRPQSYYEPSQAPMFTYPQPIYETAEPASPQLPERRPSRRHGRPQIERVRAEEEDEVREIGPHPALRSESRSRHEQRPVIRHAATTTTAYLASHHRANAREREEDFSSRQPTSRKQSFEEPSRSRRPSLSRHPRSSDEKVAQAPQYEKEKARMRGQREQPPSQARRRPSGHGNDGIKDLEGTVDEVEEYQASKGNLRGTSTATPLPDELRRLTTVTKKKTHNSSSDSGSRVSRRSKGSRGPGSDVKSQRRPSDDSKKQENDDQSLEMRIPKGVQVKLQPGIEGRTVSVRSNQNGEGDMELYIGERGQQAGGRSTPRDRSQKRYSIVEGQAVVKADVAHNTDRYYRREPEPEYAPPRIVRERIVTTSRSRRNSRSMFIPQEGVPF